MRRMLCVALALLLCFATVGATAELELVSELFHEDYSRHTVTWAPGGVGLLQIHGANGYYLADLDGTPLTGEYGSSFSQEGQLMTTTRLDAEDINSKGALNADCEEVIPFEYGRISELGAEWMRAYKLIESGADYSDFDVRVNGDEEVHCLIDTVDLYHLESENWECVATIPRENFKSASAWGDTIKVEDRATGVVTAYDSQFNALGEVDHIASKDYSNAVVAFRGENYLYGLKDGDGNVILEPTYDYIDTGLDGDEYFIVEMGDLKGLIDKTGAVIISPEYDQVRSASLWSPRTVGEEYDNAGFYAVEKADMLGYIAVDGEVTCETKYPIEALDVHGASAIYTDMEGKEYILAADDVKVSINDIVDDSGYISPLNNGSGVFYEFVEGWDNGLIDFHGKEVLPCEYKWLEISFDGNYLLAADEDYNNLIYKLDYEAAGAMAPCETDDASARGGSIVEVSQPEGQIVEVSVPEGQIIEVPAAAEAPAEVSGMKAIGAIGESFEAAAAEAGLGESAEAAATGATGTAGAAADLVDSALLVLRADAATNSQAAVALLNSALAQLGDEHPASAMLAGAIALLDAGAADNGAVAISLLESARSMM